MSIELRGIMPALVTPLNEDEQFVSRPLEQLLERVYAAGSHGVYVCGQTGEGLQLSADVRTAATEVAVRNSPRGKQVIVHVGAWRTAEAVALARHAARAGANAVSSLPPSSAYSFAEVRAYYKAIASASDLPVLVYYFPEFSRAVTKLEQILELCSIPNVVGLKFTDFDFYGLSLISRSGHVIFNGRDEALAAGLLMGASGGIGSFYNLIPELFVEVWDSARTGDYARARSVQDRINDFITAVLRFPLLAAIKMLLTWSGIACGPAVAPRRRLTREEEEQLRAAVTESGFDPEGFLSRPAVTSV